LGEFAESTKEGSFPLLSTFSLLNIPLVSFTSWFLKSDLKTLTNIDFRFCFGVSLIPYKLFFSFPSGESLKDPAKSFLIDEYMSLMSSIAVLSSIALLSWCDLDLLNFTEGGVPDDIEDSLLFSVITWVF
jgi:hypothetical protein